MESNARLMSCRVGTRCAVTVVSIVMASSELAMLSPDGISCSARMESQFSVTAIRPIACTGMEE